MATTTPTVAALTADEQSYIDSLHSLGNALPGVVAMGMNTPTLVWIGHRYCDVLQHENVGEVLASVTSALEGFVTSGMQGQNDGRSGASYIAAEADHWLCPSLAYLNRPAVPRPGGRSGLEVGSVPEFPDSRVAFNPSLPIGWPDDDKLAQPVKLDQLSQQDESVVQKIIAAGSTSQDQYLLASAAHDACKHVGNGEDRLQVYGDLALLYPGLSYHDAVYVHSAATTYLC